MYGRTRNLCRKFLTSIFEGNALNQSSLIVLRSKGPHLLSPSSGFWMSASSPLKPSEKPTSFAITHKKWAMVIKTVEFNKLPNVPTMLIWAQGDMCSHHHSFLLIPLCHAITWHQMLVEEVTEMKHCVTKEWKWIAGRKFLIVSCSVLELRELSRISKSHRDRRLFPSRPYCNYHPKPFVLYALSVVVC